MDRWIKASLEFASFFSYRVPNTSPQFALASPVPSPAAVKLALVDAAIKMSGLVSRGEEIFNVLKKVPVEINVPNRVTVMRYFIKRLKPNEGGLIESTAVREYCHFNEPLSLFIKVPDISLGEVKQLFFYLGRLGTTDSLLWCDIVEECEPDFTLSWVNLEEFSLPISGDNLERRVIVTLNDIDESATFDCINPYSSRGGRRFVKITKMLPLVIEEKAENWVRYQRKPFVLE